MVKRSIYIWFIYSFFFEQKRLDTYIENWSLVIKHLGQRVNWITGELSIGGFKSSYSLNIDHSPLDSQLSTIIQWGDRICPVQSCNEKIFPNMVFNIIHQFIFHQFIQAFFCSICHHAFAGEHALMGHTQRKHHVHSLSERATCLRRMGFKIRRETLV